MMDTETQDLSKVIASINPTMSIHDGREGELAEDGRSCEAKAQGLALCTLPSIKGECAYPTTLAWLIIVTSRAAKDNSQRGMRMGRELTCPQATTTRLLAGSENLR